MLHNTKIENFLLFLNITKEERIALNYYQAIISRRFANLLVEYQSTNGQ